MRVIEIRKKFKEPQKNNLKRKRQKENKTYEKFRKKYIPAPWSPDRSRS